MQAISADSHHRLGISPPWLAENTSHHQNKNQFPPLIKQLIEKAIE